MKPYAQEKPYPQEQGKPYPKAQETAKYDDYNKYPKTGLNNQYAKQDS